jgi:hydrogenase nickel incorporation protein HypA/HybF
MHEMGLACSVVTEIERVLSDFSREARAVTVTLQIGKLRAVVPEAMTFCFEAASQGTRAQGAVLLIEQVPVRVRCVCCDREWEAEALEFFCSDCDQPLQVLSGKELLLRTIEVDDPEE